MDNLKLDIWGRIKSLTEYNNWYIYIDSKEMPGNYYIYFKNYLTPGKGIGYDNWFATFQEVKNQLRYLKIEEIYFFEEKEKLEILKNENNI